MSPRIRGIFSYIFFLTVLWGCQKSIDYEPWLKCDLIGRVYTFDQFGNLKEDHSGVRIITSGVKLDYQAVTAKDGRFQIRFLPNGTYDIQFSKSGYGLLKQFGIIHLGGKPTVLPEIFYLYEIPTAQFTDILLSDDTIRVKITDDGNNLSRKIFIRMYFSTQQAFTSDQVELVNDFFLTSDGDEYAGKPDWPFFINTWPWDNVFFTGFFGPGTQIFYRASLFTQVPGGIDGYINEDRTRWIYPNLGDESEEYSLVIQE
jgi:hypothetical protein